MSPDEITELRRIAVRHLDHAVFTMDKVVHELAAVDTSRPQFEKWAEVRRTVRDLARVVYDLFQQEALARAPEGLTEEERPRWARALHEWVLPHLPETGNQANCARAGTWRARWTRCSGCSGTRWTIRRAPSAGLPS